MIGFNTGKVGTLRKLIISIIEIIWEHWVTWSWGYQFLVWPRSLFAQIHSFWDFDVWSEVFKWLVCYWSRSIKSWCSRLLNTLLLYYYWSSNFNLFLVSPYWGQFFLSFKKEFELPRARETTRCLLKILRIITRKKAFFIFTVIGALSGEWRHTERGWFLGWNFALNEWYWWVLL